MTIALVLDPVDGVPVADADGHLWRTVRPGRRRAYISGVRVPYAIAIALRLWRRR